MQFYVSTSKNADNLIVRQFINKLRELSYTIIVSGEVDDWQKAIQDSVIFILIWEGAASTNSAEWQLALQSKRHMLIVPFDKLETLPDELKSVEVFQWSLYEDDRYAGQQGIYAQSIGGAIADQLHQKLRNDYARSAPPPQELPMAEPEPSDMPDWLTDDEMVLPEAESPLEPPKTEAKPTEKPDLVIDVLDDFDEAEQAKSAEEPPAPPQPQPVPPITAPGTTTPYPAQPSQNATPPMQAPQQQARGGDYEPEKDGTAVGGVVRRRQTATLEVYVEPPQFTTFYPEAVQPGKPYALMVFAHVDTMLDAVRKIAGDFAPMMGGKQSSGTATSRAEVKTGDTLTFVPRFPNLQFMPSQQTVQWQPPHQQATFLFTVPPNVTENLIGVVQVYKDPLLIGEIPVMMQVTKSEPHLKLNKEGGFQKFDPIFASYSHVDTPVMEYFRQSRQSLGQKMLVDIYDLRIGDHWEKRLLQMIDECAVFQLFWSKHSAASPYCKQEWEYALQYDGVRPRFIQPVYWEGDSPLPNPVPELDHIQFQKVYVPPLTRVQAVFARTRRLLKKWV